MSEPKAKFHFFKSTFFKLLSWNSISIIFKIIMGLVSSKLIAIHLGLQGITTLENFRNFTNIGDNVSQAGIQNGIVKAFSIADEQSQDRKVFSTSLLLLVVLTVITSILVLVFKSPIESYILKENIFSAIIVLYALCLPIISIQTVIVNYFQGKQFFKKVILINCLGYLINILLSFYLIIQYQLLGAMYQIIIAPLVLTIITFFLFIKEKQTGNLISFPLFDKSTAQILFRYSLMNLVSSILAPVSYITIRNLIETQLGTESSAIWSSILRLSGFYMMFVTSICSLYFFPKLAKESSKQSQKMIVKTYLRHFLPIIFFGLLLCFVLQNLIFILVYTKEFLVLKNYFYLQLIADFIKSFALIFGYYLLANQYIKKFIFFEIISLGSYILSSVLLISVFELKGVYYSLIFSMIIYLIMVSVNYLKNK